MGGNEAKKTELKITRGGELEGRRKFEIIIYFIWNLNKKMKTQKTKKKS